MPRDLVIGNGKVHVNFDEYYHLRDIYFPHIGKENHTQGGLSRFGVYCDGTFSWVHDNSWEKKIGYLNDSLVSEVTLYNPTLQLKIVCHDAIDFHRDIYMREAIVENLSQKEREIRLFFHHDFNINENSVGDTAYFRPDDHSLVHYKGERYFFINVCTEEKCGWDEYATGIKGREGSEGTWRDAEDGKLSGNPISQGSVDSTGAIHLTLKGGAKMHVSYWIAMGENYSQVKELNYRLLNKGFHEFLNRTINYWNIWSNKDARDFDGLPEGVISLFKKSLLMIRAHVDECGAIVAAADSDVLKFNRDTYCYVWPRDGALAAYALDKAYYPGLSVPFYYFCRLTITTEGYMLHKYNPDKSLGSSWHPWAGQHPPILPIQEDGTALVIWSLWKHFLVYRDIEALKELYRPLIIRAGNFLKRYRDTATGLPFASYDLWEERKGIFSFTTGTVYGGLQGAAYFAQAFGEMALADEYLKAADEIKAACDKYLWSEKDGRFLRGLLMNKESFTPDNTIDASSVFGLYYFGMYEADDPRIVSTMHAVKEKLWVPTKIGGIARYEKDNYYLDSKYSGKVPGNPWIISTLWYAEWLIKKAKTLSDLNEGLQMLQWVVERAQPSGLLSEQLHPEAGTPLSICPLTWSHATFVLSVLEYLEKKEQLERKSEK